MEVQLRDKGNPNPKERRMRKLTIEINLDNAAFEEDEKPEVAKILRNYAEIIADGNSINRNLFDTNGNRVGFAIRRTEDAE